MDLGYHQIEEAVQKRIHCPTVEHIGVGPDYLSFAIVIYLCESTVPPHITTRCAHEFVHNVTSPNFTFLGEVGLNHIPQIQ